MGVGKTTVGKRLATKLSRTFKDLDHVIEELESTTIADIFDSKGEEAFRNIETKALSSLQDVGGLVLSLGGGTPCFNDNMNLLLNSGVVVYLKMSPAMLCSRLKSAKTERPLIRDKEDAALLEFITQLLEEREEYYSQAHITFPAENLNAENMESLVKKIQERTA